MCGHAERQARQAAGTPRNPSASSVVAVGLDDRQALVAVRRRAAVAGQVLHHRQHAAIQQPARHRAGNGGDLVRTRAVGAVADHRSWPCDRHIGERKAVDVDAERLQIVQRSAGAPSRAAARAGRGIAIVKFAVGGAGRISGQCGGPSRCTRPPS